MMKHLILTGLVAFGLSTSAFAALDLDVPTLNLPDLGDSANNTLSSTEESVLGVKLIRELRGSEPVVEDPELSGWLRALGNRLAAQAPGGIGNYYFLIVKNAEINAYAMPGGVVVIHSGLILNTESESELAAVIAHEIAHVSQRHIARMMAGGKSNPLLTGLGVLAGAAAASKSPEAAQAIITGAIASEFHRQLSFSRQMETEADRTGLRILAGAGLDPQAMPLFMEKLDRRTSDVNGDITQYLRTHPQSIDRLSDTRERANQLGKRPVREDGDYLYAREKLRAITTSGSSRVAHGNPQLAQYAEAASQLHRGNAKAVLQLLGTQSRELPVALTIAEALNISQRYTDTEALLTPLANAYPGQEAILVPLAEALLANQQSAKAWQLMSRARLTEQTSLEFLEVRQRVAEQAGQPVEAYRSAAERSLRMGEYKHARAILEQASRLPGNPAQTSAQLQAMARDIERMESQQKQLDKF
ncbi:M48 family metalloprotease [Thiothrix lacustris]|uniref:M48 family metalloprotease n=1 Tax=Thiothrix lacustris TaxID=525917 RepID=A0ABY9MLJ4_9GAMM|nr:M48 family metalloprotease [Thiothrix lacustris]WML89403.1 M48 family metalloprotease [Thiothrix lacustris]